MRPLFRLNACSSRDILYRSFLINPGDTSGFDGSVESVLILGSLRSSRVKPKPRSWLPGCITCLQLTLSSPLELCWNPMVDFHGRVLAVSPTLRLTHSWNAGPDDAKLHCECKDCAFSTSLAAYNLPSSFIPAARTMTDLPTYLM